MIDIGKDLQRAAHIVGQGRMVKKMYEDFSNVNIADELRLYETICRHTEQEAAADLVKRASEVIVELMKERDDLNAQYTKAIYGVMPMWIPVTERLPEEYKNVLCYYEYFRFGDFNCMFRTIDRGYYGNGIWGGEAGQGIKNKVLAWMPLPEPPKGL